MGMRAPHVLARVVGGPEVERRLVAEGHDADEEASVPDVQATHDVLHEAQHRQPVPAPDGAARVDEERYVRLFVAAVCGGEDTGEDGCACVFECVCVCVCECVCVCGRV